MNQSVVSDIRNDVRIKNIISDIRIKTMCLGHFSINTLKGTINEIGMYKAFPRVSLPNSTPHHSEYLFHFCMMEGSIPKILYLVYEFKEQGKTSPK